MSLKGILKPLTAWKRAFEKPATIEVPNKLIREAAQRYRGFHINDIDKCIGCGTCSNICENNAIQMVKIKEPSKGDSGYRPKIDYGRCCWCALCVDVCPTGSLSMTNEYIWVRDNPDDFVFIPGVDIKGHEKREKGYKKDDDSMLLLMNRVPMKELPGKERVKTFAEVVIGYTEEEARKEAQRCIGCGLCISGCPARMHIPDYIRAIAEGNDLASLNIIYENNPLPEMCGKVCTRRCEFECSLGHLGDPVAIRWLKRYVVERFDDLKEYVEAKPQPDNGKRIAIIGAGPSGLTVAYYLRLQGYETEIFEAADKAGGMTYLGIPKYRFPIPSLEKQIALIESRGVKIHYSSPVTPEKFKELYENYDAVFLGTGLPKGMSMGIPGEDHPQVIYAIDFLRKVNLGEKVELGEKVVVVGGGNVAIDAVRTAKRLGADSFIAYRRRKVDMPADEEEIEATEHEGIPIYEKIIPLRIEPAEGGKVKLIYGKAKMVQKEGERRPRPVLIEGVEYEYIVDRVIVAIGQMPDLSYLPDEIKEKLEFERRLIKVNFRQMTSVEKVFAGGDLTNRTADAISAIADGMRAVKGIDLWLKGKINWGEE